MWTQGRSSSAGEEREEGEDDEGDAHDPGRLVRRVQGRLPVRAGLVEALLAAEGEDLEPAHVVGGQHGGDQADDPQPLVVRE